MTICNILSLFFSKNLNHICDLFEDNGKMRSREDLRAKLYLNNNKSFTRDKQIIHVFLECGSNINNLINKHLIKKRKIYCLGKLNIRELYNM